MNKFVYLIVTTTILSDGVSEQVLLKRSQVEVPGQPELTKSLKSLADDQRLEAKTTLENKLEWWEQSFEQTSRLIAFGSSEQSTADEFDKLDSDPKSTEGEGTELSEGS